MFEVYMYGQLVSSMLLFFIKQICMIALATVKTAILRRRPSEDPAELGSCKGVARASSEETLCALVWAVSVLI